MNAPGLPHSPRHPDVHLFRTEREWLAFVVNGSRIYSIGRDRYLEIEKAIVDGGHSVDAMLDHHGLAALPYVDDDPIRSPPIRSLSLALAQTCNLGCTYCYAQGGSFGGTSKGMSRETARAAVDRLFEEVTEGARVNLAFLGGEPLINRAVLRSATEHARRRAIEKGVEIGFSLTTNGTLIEQADCEFLEEHGFAVTVSLDGIGEVHDRQRPLLGGRGSYDRIIERILPLLRLQRCMQVSARVTVTPLNLCLRQTLTELIDLGFHSVGFSPMLASPGRRGEMTADDLDIMLGQMVECGHEFERRVVAGDRFPFSNLVTAMREIHRGTHRPYPCGAGASYLGVSADGDLFACHRFVNDDRTAMGSLRGGVDRARQNEWLSDRHVHRQEPCRSCWARYLCGGGCHHEVIHRGRPACDYIRGWLHYCLEAYIRLVELRPDYFGSPAN